MKQVLRQITKQIVKRMMRPERKIKHKYTEWRNF